VLTATARKYGLCVTACRSVSFGRAEDSFRQEHEAACKIIATHVGATWPDAIPRNILHSGRRVYQISGFEHEWRLCPAGFVTGRVPVEMLFRPDTEELFQAGWAVTWQTRVGAAALCDTYLTTEKGPELMTPTEAWPLKCIRYHGADLFMPCALER
jgi:hypothetical protein